MPLYKGSTEIAGGDLYKASTQVEKVYKGTDLIYQNAFEVDFLVVAGGAGTRGSTVPMGGGGAGGYRTSYSGGSGVSGGGAALESKAALVPGITYTATVGAGGAYSTGGTAGGASSLIGGAVSISCVGGGSSGLGTGGNGVIGGSGGGGVSGQVAGNPVNGSGGAGTAGEGYAGGGSTQTSYSGDLQRGGGGGGGAGGVGTDYVYSTGANDSAPGGPGLYNTITGVSVGYAGGANGQTTGRTPEADATQSAFGVRFNSDAVANTGSAGAGASGGFAGSGVVIIRIPTANYSGTTTGSPTVTTDGTDTIIKFTGTGTYTA